MADKITSEDLIDIKSFQDADKIISASLNSLATQAEALQTNYKELGSLVNKNNEQIKKSFQEQQKLAKQKDATNAEERKDIIAITKEMDKLTKAYKDNTKAQDKLQKEQKETDNSLESLKKQYKDLRKQAEGLDVGSDEFKQAAKEARELNDRIKDSAQAFRTNNNVIEATKGSYAELVQRNKLLNRELRNLPNAFDKTNKRANELKKQIKANTDQLKAFDAELGQNFRNVGNYQQAIEGAIQESGLFSNELAQLQKIQATLNKLFKVGAEDTEAFGKATSKATGLNAKFIKGLKGLKTALAASGIGAIVVALGALFTFLTKTQGGTEKLNKAFAAVGATVDVLIDRFATLGEGVFLIFSGKFSKGAELLKASFQDITTEIKEESAAAARLAAQLDQLRKDESAFEAERSKQLARISELRLKAAENEKKSVEISIKALKEAQKIEKELADQQESLQLRRFANLLGLKDEAEARKRLNSFIEDGNKLTIKELGLSNSTTEDLEEANQLLGKIIETRTAENNKLRSRQKEINALEQRRTGELKKNAAERDKIRKQEAKRANEYQNSIDENFQKSNEKFQKEFEETQKELANSNLQISESSEESRLSQEEFYRGATRQADLLGVALDNLGQKNDKLQRLVVLFKLLQQFTQARNNGDTAQGARAQEGLFGFALNQAFSSGRQFKDGTNYSPQGYALVGEEGAELAINPSGQAALLGVNSPEVAYLQQGTKIYTASETKEMLSNIDKINATQTTKIINQSNIDYDKLGRVIANNIPSSDFSSLADHILETRRKGSTTEKTIFKQRNKAIRGL